MMTTEETTMPWIHWHYERPDWLAFILGGIIRGECLICGRTERLHLGWWGIWFPNSERTKQQLKLTPPQHWKRISFKFDHAHNGHPGTILPQGRLFWTKPLAGV